MAQAGPSPQQIEFLKKTAGGLLVEFVASSLHELLKYSEHTQVYEIVKKMTTDFTINSPILQIESIAKKKGIDRIIAYILVHASAMCGPDNTQGEIREKGAVGTFYNCIYKNVRPELCVFVSHLGGEVLCQIIDPELECLFTHHMTDGDPFCRFTIKKKITPYKDPDSLGNIIMKLPRVDVTDEWLAQYRKLQVASCWYGFTTIFKMLHGPEKTLEVLGANAKRIGKNFGSSLIEANMLPARDIAVIGNLLNQFGEGFAMQGRITSMAPGVITKEITECPFKGAPFEMGPPEICRQWEAFYNGALEAINPELEFRYDKMMTAGDKTCKWVISKK